MALVSRDLARLGPCCCSPISFISLLSIVVFLSLVLFCAGRPHLCSSWLAEQLALSCRASCSPSAFHGARPGLSSLLVMATVRSLLLCRMQASLPEFRHPRPLPCFLGCVSFCRPSSALRFPFLCACARRAASHWPAVQLASTSYVPCSSSTVARSSPLCR
ncbi:hypothetical protein Zm00014a_014428 [Zea mays]|uniref:Uncharacterized protein n=1 Tax=Zea mays TaxID=4577 RepID=A0A3L6DME8_MAIZE|nr:uncharacterized protein LOC103636995 [Zea mays]PWZ09755.1 hypothetical protein Zm00014a_014428 [Zea mays]|eukprot:XP_008657505.2 uncharacterized protein LOC103636995 [Zea mays]